MLIKCSECGNTISTDAATCPQCGHKKPFPLGKHLRGIGLTVLGIFTLIFVLAIVGALLK